MELHSELERIYVANLNEVCERLNKAGDYYHLQGCADLAHLLKDPEVYIAMKKEQDPTIDLFQINEVMRGQEDQLLNDYWVESITLLDYSGNEWTYNRQRVKNRCTY